LQPLGNGVALSLAAEDPAGRRRDMPARIVVVHDELSFRDSLVESLKASGHDVAAFADTIAAWDALAAAQRVEILITRADFGPGKPHGIALARSARTRRAGIRTLFVARPEYTEDVAQVGLFLPYPATVPQVAEVVEQMLADDQLGAFQPPRAART
jgi:DNA-binding NtrC family response regulator